MFGLKASQATVAPAPARVFISYKRNSDPDETIARKVYEALGQRHEVFIDQTMTVGTRWAERIQRELARSDFLITFLSAQSVTSEMVLGEIQMAHDLAKEQAGRPAILPVRVAYSGKFNYPLNVIIDPLHWLVWNGPEDADEVIESLMAAVSGGLLTSEPQRSDATVVEVKEPSLPAPLPQAQPLSLEMPEGTMDPQSKFYVTRQSDSMALEAIAGQGETITIKGPRQMGKSSLLLRTMAAADDAGKRLVFLDFQQINQETLASADLFFRQFCSWLTVELEMEDRVDEYWQLPLGNNQRCTRYVGRYLLKELDAPLVLGIDEVDSVFDTDFRSDFFGMLRSWHNSRATGALSRERAVWRGLDLVLVTSTEPYQLIENLNQSPFNVGLKIELDDFNSEQVADLNYRHGSPLKPGELDQLMNLLNGHPYLVRRALYLIASGQESAGDLFARATEDRGPFGDHLRYHILRMHNKNDLIRGLLRVIRQHKCPDERLFFRLQGAGLVRRGPEKGTVVPRCQLYADYFREHLYE